MSSSLPMASQNSASPKRAAVHTLRMKYTKIKTEVRMAGLRAFQ